MRGQEERGLGETEGLSELAFLHVRVDWLKFLMLGVGDSSGIRGHSRSPLLCLFYLNL